MTSQPQSRENCKTAKMAGSRFTSVDQDGIAKLISEKDSESTKKATKWYKNLFDEYLHHKNTVSEECRGIGSDFKTFFMPRQESKMKVFCCIYRCFECMIKRLLDSAYALYQELSRPWSMLSSSAFGFGK